MTIKTKTNKHFLICFTGIDGSGKTTLATSLKVMLQRRGTQTRYVWGAHNFLLLRPLIVLLKRRSYARLRSPGQKKDPQIGQWAFEKKIVSQWCMARFYRVLVLSEYALQIFFKIRLPLILGRNIICDRYVYDTAVNVAVNLRYSQWQFKTMLDGLMKSCPRPDIVFFVDLPANAAYRRKNDIPSVDYLVRRRAFYHFLAKEYAMEWLNGTKDLYELKQAIQKTVQCTLSLNKGSDDCVEFFARTSAPSSALVKN